MARRIQPQYMVARYSRSERQCEEGLRSPKLQGDEGGVCKPVGLSKEDFDHDSQFAVCSHRQPQDLALHLNGSYEPLVSMCGNWERYDIEFMRTVFLKAYEEKWIARGGIALCDIFDQAVSGK